MSGPGLCAVEFHLASCLRLQLYPLSWTTGTWYTKERFVLDSASAVLNQLIPFLHCFDGLHGNTTICCMLHISWACGEWATGKSTLFNFDAANKISTFYVSFNAQLALRHTCLTGRKLSLSLSLYIYKDYKAAQILPLSSRLKSNKARFVHKIVSGREPIYLSTAKIID